MARRILIVDDSPLVHEIYGNELEEGGYEILHSRDALEAINIVFSEMPDLVLLDIQMPKINGYQLCRLLKDHPVTRDIPIILITGDAGKGVVEDPRNWSFQTGANAYLEKSPDIPLTELVRSFVDKAEDRSSRRGMHPPMSEHEILLALSQILDKQLYLDTNRLEKLKAMEESANKAKSQFLAKMSHEIRTPMNAIIGFTEILLDTEVTDDQENALNIIKTSGESLLALINDILDLSKIEAGKLTLEERDFDFEKMIMDVMAMTNIQISNDEVELVCLVDEKIKPYYIGDVVRIKQILINLLSNSCKFTDSGHVKLEVSSVNENDSGCEIEFIIDDTGKGIKKEALEKIFDPFSQEDESVTRKYGGTGLGLTITKNLVRKMNGTITADSEEGRGTAFAVRIKLLRSAQQESGKQDYQQLLEGKKVAMICAKPVAAKVVQQIFATLKVGFTNFTTEKLFLDSMEDTDTIPDILLVDVVKADDQLSQMMKNVREKVLSICKVIQTASDTKYVALSRNQDFCEKRRFVDYGFDGCYRKPILKKPLLLYLDCVLKPSDSLKGKSCPKEASKEKLLTGKKILVAEDNAINQKLIKEMLRKFACTVTIAEDGVEAISRIQEEQFDLVLMDFQMPNMGGLEATRKIRQLGYELPIIALTAHAMKGQDEEAKSAGMNDYLSKPVSMALLKEKLSKYI